MRSQKIYIIKDRRLALEKKKDQSLKHCKENNLLMDKTCHQKSKIGKQMYKRLCPTDVLEFNFEGTYSDS